MANITFSEGSGLNDSIFGKSQEPIKMLIEDRAEAFEQKSIIEEVFMHDTSKHWAEKLTSMTAMDGFQPVGENGPYPVDGTQEGFDKILIHEVWKDSFTISREIIDDGKLIDLKKKPTSFVKGYYRTRENFGAALFGGAIKNAGSNVTTVNFKGRDWDIAAGDGLSYFNKSHKAKVKGAVQSNLYSNAFSADALAYMESAMQNFKGDNQELVDVIPNTILIPNDPGLKKAVFAAIGADKDPDTANNGYNYVFGRWNVIIWNYLNQFITSSTQPWLLGDLNYNEEYGGAVFLDRVALEVSSKYDDGNDANVWRGYSRFIAGFYDWRAFACGGITGGTDLGIE